MSDDASPGLFQGHMERGRALFAEQRFDDAIAELQEACLLRPRDGVSLNLLGLSYFRSGRHEKAEEVYRKLIAENPEAGTLHYNLGLIYYKQGRHEDAELAFLKSLELSGGNPKVHYYLGSIYEQLKRFQDAIHQYRLAGASPQARFKLPPPPQTPKRRMSDTRPLQAIKVSPSSGKRPSTDTAEFRVTEYTQTTDSTLPFKTLEPVSPTLMAEGAPPRVAAQPAPPPSAPPSPPEPVPETAGPFELVEASLLRVAFEGKFFIKQGTLYSYSGNITFWVKDRRPGGTPALVIVTGSGKLLLKDRDRQIRLASVNGSPLFVEPSRILACEESLNPRYITLGRRQNAEVLSLEGAGHVALSLSGSSLRLRVTPEEPVAVPLRSLVSWHGDIQAELVEDSQLRDVLAPSDEHQGLLVRLEGRGEVEVEKTVG